MATTETSGESRIFLRKASGLIKTAGTFDIFIYNLGLVSVGLGVISILFYGPAFYPGGDLVIACFIAGFAMILIALGFIAWSVTLPRSGGIYVFGSRSLPPFIALTISLVEITAWLFYCAIAAYWIIILGIGPMLAMICYLTGGEVWLEASAWITSPVPLFFVGSGILIPLLAAVAHADGYVTFGRRGRRGQRQWMRRDGLGRCGSRYRRRSRSRFVYGPCSQGGVFQQPLCYPRPGIAVPEFRHRHDRSGHR